MRTPNTFVRNTGLNLLEGRDPGSAAYNVADHDTGLIF